MPNGTAVKYRLKGTDVVLREVFTSDIEDGKVVRPHAAKAMLFIDDIRQHEHIELEPRKNAAGVEYKVPVTVVDKSAKADYFVAYPVTVK